MKCARHTERTAEELCFACETPLCLSCVKRLGGAVYCARCYAPRFQKRNRIRLAVAGVVGLCVVGAGIWLFLAKKAENEERQRYGTHREDVEKLRAALAEDACNLRNVDKLATLLEDTHNPDEAITALADAAVRCPADRPLLERLGSLQRENGELRGALETAEKLIETAPKAAAGYSLRGAVRARQGQAGALEDLTQAFELDPSDKVAAMALADAEEGQGEVCRAAEVIDELLAYGGATEVTALRRRSERLREKGGCPRETIDGDKAVIPFVRKGDVMVVDVRINDRYTTKMLLDTGASSVAITRSLADRIGIDRWEGETIWVSTAGGIAQARRIRLESVGLGGARVEKVRAAIVGTMGSEDGVEGLLGNSFLARFELSVDAAGGRITLKARE